MPSFWSSRAHLDAELGCLPAIELDAPRADSLAFGVPMAMPQDNPFVQFSVSGTFLNRPNDGPAARWKVLLLLFIEGEQALLRLQLNPLVKRDMASRQPSGKCNHAILQETARAAFSRRPILHEALELILQDAQESLSFQGLRFPPFITAHRNLISQEPFLLPEDRFGGSQDVALVPLVRHVVDEALRAYASRR